MDQGSHTVRVAYEKILYGALVKILPGSMNIVLAKPFGISGEITINNRKIPIFRVISGPVNGYLDEYGGVGVPWTIF